MDRIVQTLLLVLVIAGLGNAFVVWDADRHARDAAAWERKATEERLCLERAEATALVALLAPADRIDERGRIDAMGELGAQVDGC